MRLVKRALLVLAPLAVVGVVLYQFFGLRIVLRGGGTPRLAFVKSTEAQAREIEEHRERQRTVAELAKVPTPGSPPIYPEAADSFLAPPPVPPRPAISPLAWADFRGPTRDGVYRETRVVTDWPTGGMSPLWKQPIGAGYASFVAAGGRAYTIEQRGPNEVAAAYDVTSGRELWKQAWRADFREVMGGDGPRATPTLSGGILYALGAEGELRSLEASSGQVLWRTNILEDNGAANIQWGMSASPLVVDDAVVVLPGGPDGRSVAAYDRQTGKRMWTALDDRAAYASPMLVTLAGVRQILVFTASRVVALSPGRGDVLWDYPWTTSYDVNAAQPIVIGDNRVFVSSGYGTGAAVVEIAAAADGRLSAREIWRNVRMKNRFASSVLHEGHLFGFDESILACVDAATGELKWKGGRYGYGQLRLASGHLIVLSEEGDLALVRAIPTGHEEVARFPAISGKTWNVPAIADGILLVRNLREMAAFDLRKTPLSLK